MRSSLCLGRGMSFRAFASQRPALAGSPKELSGQTTSRFVVSNDAEEGHTRLDTCISNFDSGASRQQIQNSIRKGMVSVNGIRATKPSQKARSGDVVIYDLIQSTPSKVSPEPIPLDVVYSDSDIMIINKEPGMVVHPSAGHWSGTLVNALMHYLDLPAWDLTSATHNPLSLEDLQSGPRSSSEEGLYVQSQRISTAGTKQKRELGPDDLDMNPIESFRPGIVHRLDIGTSGLMVVALNDTSRRHLSEQFKNRTVNRVYLSILSGCPNPESGKISTNIGRDPNDRKAMTWFGYKSMKGRPSSSNYQTVETIGEGSSLVAWKLHSGRTHQIRVHAKYMRHPVLCDEMYGPSTINVGDIHDESQWQDGLGTSCLMNRPALHAASLELEHPVTHDRMSFKSNLPADFVACLSKLRNMDVRV